MNDTQLAKFIIASVAAAALMIYVVGRIVWSSIDKDDTVWYAEGSQPIPNRQIGFRNDGMVVWRFSTNNPANK